MANIVRSTQTVPPIVAVRQRFDERMHEITAALPPDISYAQFLRAAMTSMSLNPDILGCSWQSLWLACLQACRDGLLPDGVEGAIVPYKSRATWVPMYQGLLRRFRRSGHFKWVTAGLARKGERFEHFVDQHGEHFYHEPKENWGAPIERVYALATTKDGGTFVTVMSIEEANGIRQFSKNTRDDAPWKMWPSEMYKKTALKRLSKMLPSARDLMPADEVETPELAEDAPATAPVGALVAARDHRAPAAALSQFAADDEIEHQRAAHAAPGDEADAGGSIAADAPQDAPVPPPDHDSLAEALAMAYERGRDWRAKGYARKATPPEYRAHERRPEAVAWQAGFDGVPMPLPDRDSALL
jgi:recombination protein RecT